MKVALLAGGFGTRIREETEFRPKPLVEIGERPILWHIMKLYAHFGHKEFIVCLGYKGDAIRDYFLNYEMRNCDVTVTLGDRAVEIHGAHEEQGWRVTLAETGLATMTGGRLKRVTRWLVGPGFNNSGSAAALTRLPQDESAGAVGEPFLVTYGDGVANVDLAALVAFHKASGRLATVTAVRPSSRFGELSIDGGIVTGFQEKPQVKEGWINGGFFVFQPEVLEMIAGDREPLEEGVLTRLAADHQLAVFQHEGFWQCMDTYREMQLLNQLWAGGKAPWAVWRGRGGDGRGAG